MLARILTLMLVAVLSSSAASKKPAAGRAENEEVAITASVLPDREAVKEALGSDLGGHFVVVDVRLAPKTGKVNVHRDDFLLRTDRDGAITSSSDGHRISVHAFVSTSGSAILAQTSK